MKRIIEIGLIIVMALCFCACGKTETAPQKPDLNGYVKSMNIKDGFKPKLGIVLGSGLHPLAEEVEVVQTIPYDKIPGFPHSTVKGHEGKYILGYLEGVPVILMDGRVHYYEGYSMDQVVTPARVMGKLGVETVILTNASGILTKDFDPGDLVCINDHISSFIPNPLIGQNDDTLGERFVGMADAYDESLRKLAHEAADETGVRLRDGVYVQVTGPTYETPAESALYHSLGADIVGMSTVCETIVLRHMGVKVLGISCATNYCPNVVKASTNHEEVQENSAKASADFIKLIKTTVRKIGAEEQ